MAIQTFTLDATSYEFRYHGASEFKPYDRETEQRSKEQARDEDTGFLIYTVRCQVVNRELRESGIITIRVPLADKPSDSMEFEQPVSFTSITAKPWNMDGNSGQTWTAKTMTVLSSNGSQPATPPASTRKASKTEAAAA